MKSKIFYFILLVLVAIFVYGVFYHFASQLPENLEEPLSAAISIGFIWSFGLLITGMKMFPKLNISQQLLGTIGIVILSILEIVAVYPLIAMQSDLITSVIGMLCILVTFGVAGLVINRYKK